ncbi:hypothetical protein [Blastopirellula marina]|uniref:Uncharacterized protein n=1 Tax=Blastopirellula marina TaxID=124 RepID=A0A2S8GJP3_9BACT|nr:hypothetical protein [Blastopirellula marina]PQO44649.1 hypothetical protein C5Y93_17925 [Blastopirellula marina]
MPDDDSDQLVSAHSEQGEARTAKPIVRNEFAIAVLVLYTATAVLCRANLAVALLGIFLASLAVIRARIELTRKRKANWTLSRGVASWIVAKSAGYVMAATLAAYFGGRLLLTNEDWVGWGVWAYIMAMLGHPRLLLMMILSLVGLSTLIFLTTLFCLGPSSLAKLRQKKSREQV